MVNPGRLYSPAVQTVPAVYVRYPDLAQRYKRLSKLCCAEASKERNALDSELRRRQSLDNGLPKR